MGKPCDNCTTNINQAILYDEVTCYQTCPNWLEWRKDEEAKNETRATVKILRELRLNGKILTLRQARKIHKCGKCGLLIEVGEQYYESTIGGGGLGSLKFPERSHIECLKINKGEKGGRE